MTRLAKYFFTDEEEKAVFIVFLNLSVPVYHRGISIFRSILDSVQLGK
jgi:hypothetical protein